MDKRIVCAALSVLALASCGHPFTPIENPTARGDYAVLAWNDLGMHCLNPSYDKAVILPPYNNLVAQVVKRGDPPEVVTSGITVEYSIEGNTSSAGKRSFGAFWTNAVALFGDIFGITSLEVNVGLKGKGLTGTMDPTSGGSGGDHFTAEGIPVVPVDDDSTWNPYQVALITVKNAGGTVIAQTRCTVPTSDEINCAKCHGADPFQDIIDKHDAENETNLAGSTPVLCASCHDSPALGTTGGEAGIYLSKAIHGFHAEEAPSASCYDCHPGSQTKCSRSTEHTAADGNCTACHGTLAQVASSIAGGGEDDGPSGTRVPWANEPACVTCHTGVAGVDTGTVLYRNDTGHGDLRCASCHGSPHATIPTDDRAPFTNWDSYQALQYQDFSGAVKTIGSCGVCHLTSRGPPRYDARLFSKVHGGSPPKQENACHTCHTVVPADTDSWPHAHQWQDSN